MQMIKQSQMAFLVSVGCLLLSGISACLAGSEAKRELLLLLPDRSKHLWIFGKTQTGLAEPGVFSNGGIMSPDRAWYAIRPGLGPYNSEGRIILGSTETRGETTIPKPEDPRIPWADPVWSPDSRSLVYVTRRGVGGSRRPRWGVSSLSAIMRYDLVTGDVAEILRREGRIRALRFLDSGRRIFFLLEPRKGEGHYMLLDLDAGTVSAFEEDIPFDHASWPLHSHDGKFIAYTYGQGTYIYGVKQKDAREVLASDCLFSLGWSPDSRFLVGVLLRPSRNPLQRWTLLFSDNIKHVYEFWAYDTQTGETITMKLNDRIREALITWPR